MTTRLADTAFPGKKEIYGQQLRYAIVVTLCMVLAFRAFPAHGWVPLPVAEDPLVRMPGTQPNQGEELDASGTCITCHGLTEKDPQGNVIVPGFYWSGSMMAQAARDPIFWASMIVAAQDAIWAVGNPNAVDICERCHFPSGWLGGRSDPTNASQMRSTDFDGVGCDFCHRMWDPFFSTTYDGTREGDDWIGYWDEASNTGSGNGPSQNWADYTYGKDLDLVGGITRFSGSPFFQGDRPGFIMYLENAGGQYYVSPVNGLKEKRSSFADPVISSHTFLYSRYHKSKYFCSTCHDVSNPVLANLGFQGTPPGNGTTVLPTEEAPAYAYFHAERTFSEFMLSAYGQPGGAPTNPEFQKHGTADITWAATCQACHMKQITGKGCSYADAPLRPDQSDEHPTSGAPVHDQQGGNLWISYILATLDDDLPGIFDLINFQLLTAGPERLTLDMLAGRSPMDGGEALLNGSDRAKEKLKVAATIQNLAYDPNTGDLSFRIQNNTGHKLISGFPEGRRMFVNIKAYTGGNLVYEVNPYDHAVGTLKGPKFPGSAVLSSQETYVDELVYEVHPKSDLTGEAEKTFHFVLATGRFKDNRIPPKGFDIAGAADRLSEPVWQGIGDTGTSPADYYTPQEYAGGYDDVKLSGSGFPSGADTVTVTLYYQGTSREYVAFLRDEINGTANTLTSPTPSGEAQAYIVQTDPSGYFRRLKRWGDTIWDLWYHNHGLDGKGASVAGIVPFSMASATWGQPLPVIGKIRKRSVEPGDIIRIVGYGFGDIQGDNLVHVGGKTFDRLSGKIKLWTDSKIRIKIPDYPCAWFKGRDIKNRKVWVTEDGLDSNTKKIKVTKPATCP